MKTIKLTIVLSILMNCVLAQTAPKYIRDVYDNIFRSMSTGAIQKPNLILIDDLKLPKKEQEIATYNPYDKTIRIGKSFIQLTRKFGPDSSNARAHVLSHELAHLFLDHGYAKIIGTGFASSLVNKELKKTREHIEDQLGESAADQCAFFYAYISGYTTNEIVPRLLDSIYLNYQLTDKMLSKYPPLKERKEYATQAQVKMQAMNESFDFANICLAHGDYEMAKAIYKTILEEGFKSREIFSNLGAAYLLDAVKLIDTADFKYVLPIQLDFNSRLNQNSNRDIVSKEDIDELLVEAANNFSTAIIIDPTYATGYFNLSITNWFLSKNNLSKNNKTDFYLKEAIDLNDENLINKIELFSSIRNITSKDEALISLGKSNLEKLSLGAYGLAKLNWNICQGKTPSHSTQSKLHDYIKQLKKIQLPPNFMNANGILDSTFKRDTNKLLSCKELKTSHVSRKWKFSKGNKQPVVYQYIFEEKLNLDQFTKDNILYTNAKSSFETNTKKIFVFGDVILIEEKGLYSYQILKSDQ